MLTKLIIKMYVLLYGRLEVATKFALFGVIIIRIPRWLSFICISNHMEYICFLKSKKQFDIIILHDYRKTLEKEACKISFLSNPPPFQVFLKLDGVSWDFLIAFIMTFRCLTIKNFSNVFEGLLFLVFCINFL